MIGLTKAFIDFFKEIFVSIYTSNYKILFEQSIYSSFLVDKDYKIINFNKNSVEGAKKFYNKVLKKGDSILEFTSVLDTDIFKANYQRALAGQTVDLERMIIIPGGRPIWIHATYTPVYDSNKQIFGVSFNLKDITERKQAEMEVIKAKVEAEELAKIRKQLLADVSHEMRTSLNAISGIGRILLQRNPSKEQVPLLETLRFSSQHLLELVNEVLDFSKLEAGKAELVSEDFSLKILINNIIDSFRLEAEEKKLNLSVFYDPKAPEEIAGDKLKISQVLTNLVGNALKFTLKGEIYIAVKLLYDDDDTVWLSFSVTDTGIGIPENQIDKIFESFSQVSTNERNKFGGTGLGLTITKKILDLMNSEIKVKSSPGKGSIFYFDLEVSKAGLLESDVTAVKDKNILIKDFKGIKILLVEDNEINRFVALEFLKEWNIIPDIAENGQEALIKVKEKEYDLIFMDIYMPIMDGFTATSEIRKMESVHYKSVPIIALTADSINEIKEKAIASGITDFMAKPFSVDELYKNIRFYTNKKIVLKPVNKNTHEKRKLSDIILDICNNDANNIIVLRQKLIAYLEALPNDFNDAMVNKNVLKMRNIKHTFKPTAEYFQLDNVYQFLEQGVSALNDTKTYESQFQNISLKFNDICKNAIGQLEEGFMEISSN